MTIIEFISGKITDTEQAIQAREQMEETWRGGSDATWKKVAAFSGLKPTTKADRVATADIQARILVKLRRELELYNRVLDVIKDA